MSQDEQQFGGQRSMLGDPDDPLGDMLSDLLGAESNPPAVREPEAISVGLSPDSSAVSDPVEFSAASEPQDAQPAGDSGVPDPMEFSAASGESPAGHPDTTAVNAMFHELCAGLEPIPEPEMSSAIDNMLNDMLADLSLTSPDAAGLELEPLGPSVQVAVAEPEEDPPAIPAPAPAVSTETQSGPPDLSSSTLLDTLVSGIDSEAGDGFLDEFALEEAPSRKARSRQDNCIVFLLQGTRYAIPIRDVLELDAVPRITPVPNVPGFVLGVTNLRGEIIVVLDLRTLLGLERAESPERGRILIVRGADQLSAALAVDEVRGTTELTLAELVQPASPIKDKVTHVLLGVGEHQNQVLNVLDVGKLFQTPEIQQFVVN